MEGVVEEISSSSHLGGLERTLRTAPPFLTRAPIDISAAGRSTRTSTDSRDLHRPRPLLLHVSSPLMTCDELTMSFPI